MARRKRIIGLAGGMGSGKSEVARILSSLGAGVIQSDELNGAVLNEPEVISAIRSWWGDEVIGTDGRVDRRRLAAIVFADSEERRKLEGLQHPRIAALREALIREYEADPRVRAIVLDSPLLFEAGLDGMCDCVIFVEADDAVRRERVGRTRQWSREEFGRREKSQMPLDTKREKSDYVVENNASLEVLRGKVEAVLSTVLA